MTFVLLNAPFPGQIKTLDGNFWVQSDKVLSSLWDIFSAYNLSDFLVKQTLFDKILSDRIDLHLFNLFKSGDKVIKKLLGALSPGII